MRPCSLESQPYPGLHKKKHGRQDKGSDPAPLFYTGETPVETSFKAGKTALGKESEVKKATKKL